MHDVARNSDWSRASQTQPLPWEAASIMSGLSGGGDLMFTTLESRACRLHKLSSCEHSIVASMPAGVVPTGTYFDALFYWKRAWHGNEARVVADMRRDLGDERFRRFWTSPEEPAAAFASAAGMPLGKWVFDWSNQIYGRAGTGKVSLVDAIVALSLASVLLALSGYVAIRRRVR